MAKGNYESKVAQNVEKFNPGAKDTEKTVVNPELIQNVVKESAMGYQIIEERKAEVRDKRMQIVIPSALNDQLDEYVKDGVIKSKNDLVNQLLKKFVEQQG